LKFGRSLDPPGPDAGGDTFTVRLLCFAFDGTIT
jgi:hypothetical protein